MDLVDTEAADDSPPLPTTDLELVDRAREGDGDAVAELWRRYYPKALSVARGVSRQPRDAEEIASDAFAGMLAAMDGGAGPVGSVPAYLATSVRNIAASRARRRWSGELATDAVAEYADSRTDVTLDPVAHRAELGLVREAYATLPRRWQVVLWRTAVDEDSNIEIARELGLTPNGVAALARRARQGFRKAYLRAHVSTRGVDPDCEPYLDQLVDLAADRPARAGSHVAGCRRCTERVAELRVLDGQMRSVLGPAILGLVPAMWTAGAAAGTAGATATGVGAGAGAGLGVGAGAGAMGAGAGAGAMGAGAGAAAPAVPHLAWLGVTGVVAAAGVGLFVATRQPAPPAPPPHPVVSTTRTPTVPPAPHTAPTPTVTPTTLPRTLATARPRATRRPVARPSARSTTEPRMTPLTIDVALDGALSDTVATVTASAQGLSGELLLTMTLPAGSVLTSAQGDWGGCSQSGDTVRCSTPAGRAVRWTGTLHTRWPAGSHGRISSSVTGTYVTGYSVTASAGTTWPPG